MLTITGWAFWQLRFGELLLPTDGVCVAKENFKAGVYIYWQIPSHPLKTHGCVDNTKYLVLVLLVTGIEQSQLQDFGLKFKNILSLKYLY